MTRAWLVTGKPGQDQSPTRAMPAPMMFSQVCSYNNPGPARTIQSFKPSQNQCLLGTGQSQARLGMARVIHGQGYATTTNYNWPKPVQQGRGRTGSARASQVWKSTRSEPVLARARVRTRPFRSEPGRTRTSSPWLTHAEHGSA